VFLISQYSAYALLVYGLADLGSWLYTHGLGLLQYRRQQRWWLT
jgi:hypothetical protein